MGEMMIQVLQCILFAVIIVYITLVVEQLRHRYVKMQYDEFLNFYGYILKRITKLTEEADKNSNDTELDRLHVLMEYLSEVLNSTQFNNRVSIMYRKVYIWKIIPRRFRKDKRYKIFREELKVYIYTEFKKI